MSIEVVVLSLGILNALLLICITIFSIYFAIAYARRYSKLKKEIDKILEKFKKDQYEVTNSQGGKK